MKGLESGIGRGVAISRAPTTFAMSPGAKTLERGWPAMQISKPDTPQQLFRDSLRAPKFVPRRRVGSASILEQAGAIIATEFNRPVMKKFERSKGKTLKVPRYRTRIDPSVMISIAESIITRPVQVTEPEQDFQWQANIKPKQEESRSLNLVDIPRTQVKGMEVKVGRVTNPVIQPAVSARTMSEALMLSRSIHRPLLRSSSELNRVLRAVDAIATAGVIRQVQGGMTATEKGVVQMPKAVTKENPQTEPSMANNRREKNSEDQSRKKIVELKYVLDEKAFAERVKVVVQVIRMLFKGRRVITGEHIASNTPSGRINKSLKAEIVREGDNPDHTIDTLIPADLKEAGEFRSEREAIAGSLKVFSRHEPVMVRKDGKELGVRAARKVRYGEKDALRPYAVQESRVVAKMEQVQTTKTETILVNNEVVSSTTDSNQEEKIETEGTGDLPKAELTQDLKELFKLAA